MGKGLGADRSIGAKYGAKYGKNWQKIEILDVKLTGAEILTHFLADEGVEFLFGYPGGAV